MTRFYEPNLESEECWMFWYYMSGRDVGTLNVYLHESQNSGVTLWSRSGDQGERWRPGRATVVSPLSPYQVYVHTISFSSTVQLDHIWRQGMCKIIFSTDLIMICSNGATSGLCTSEEFWSTLWIWPLNLELGHFRTMSCVIRNSWLSYITFMVERSKTTSHKD